jgi:hypothetical protein
LERKAVCGGCLCHLEIYTTYLCRLHACLPRWLFIMHALRPGTDELLCFCMSRLRREELSEVFGLCACVGCASCVRLCRICCVTYTYFLSGTRRPVVLVGRYGRFGNENETKRLHVYEESACDDNSCDMTSISLRQTNVAIKSFIMCASKYPGQPGLASEVTTLFS